jgi:hypothetical protein
LLLSSLEKGAGTCFASTSLLVPTCLKVSRATG